MMAADSNPWHSRGSALGINLGDPARVLTVGRKHGLLSADSDKVIKLVASKADAIRYIHPGDGKMCCKPVVCKRICEDDSKLPRNC